jgi:2-amino-4-hydroxy-6-hydroxymethyldihydropteridine diphosphokinase
MYYYLSLGANIGNREQTILGAIEQIEQRIGPVLRCSSFYYSEPWGFESPHLFCNVCCLLDTDQSPLQVLRITQDIERLLGRTQKSNSPKDGYSDRCIDIDIIQVFDNDGHEKSFNFQLSTFNLIIPHPLWTQRDFVKIPLREIKNAEKLV